VLRRAALKKHLIFVFDLTSPIAQQIADKPIADRRSNAISESALTPCHRIAHSRTALASRSSASGLRASSITMAPRGGRTTTPKDQRRTFRRQEADRLVREREMDANLLRRMATVAYALLGLWVAVELLRVYAFGGSYSRGSEIGQVATERLAMQVRGRPVRQNPRSRSLSDLLRRTRRPTPWRAPSRPTTT